MRKGQAENDVFARLAADERLGLTADQLATLVAEPITFTGAAVAQVQEVVRRVAEVTGRHPAAAAYSPGAIL
jgi:adenylosuccinate lyase